MKKKISLTLVFAIITLLIVMTCTAVAMVTYRRSVQYDATTVAKELLQETYGIQSDWMRAFEETVTQDAGGHTVHYSPANEMNQLGEYTVYVPTSGTPTISWSYDGTDLSGMAAQGFTSDVWGAKQLEEWLAVWDEYVETYYAIQREKEANKQTTTPLSLEDWVALDNILAGVGIQPDADYLPSEMRHVGVPGENELTQEQAVRLAKLAVKRKYGAEETALDGYDADLLFEHKSQNAQSRYTVHLFHREDPTLDQIEGHYWVDLLSPSGQTARCIRYVDRDRIKLPDGPLARYEEAVREYMEVYRIFDDLSVTEKVEVSARLFDAGFGKYLDNIRYLDPEGAKMDEKEVFLSASTALKAKYGMTDDMLSNFEETAIYTLKDEQNVWIVEYAPPAKWYHSDFTEKTGVYRVVVSDKTRSVLSATWSNDSLLDSIAVYGEVDWATAPAWDARLLQWFIPFADAVCAIDEEVQALALSSTPYPEDFQWRYYEKSATIQGLFRDSGFDRTVWCEGLPGEGDISLEEALDIAREVLVADYALTREEIAHYGFSFAFNVADPQKPEWGFVASSIETGLNKTYYIVIHGKTGEVIQVIVNEQIANG